MMCRKSIGVIASVMIITFIICCQTTYAERAQNKHQQTYAFVFQEIHLQADRNSIRQMIGWFQQQGIPLYLGLGEELQELMLRQESLWTKEEKDYVDWLKSLQKNNVYFLLSQDSFSEEAKPYKMDEYIRTLFQWEMGPLGYYYENEKLYRQAFTFSVPINSRLEILRYIPPELVIERHLNRKEPLFVIIETVPDEKHMKRWFRALKTSSLTPLTPDEKESIYLNGLQVTIENNSLDRPKEALVKLEDSDEEQSWLEKISRVFIYVLLLIILSLVGIFIASKKNRERSLFG